MLRWAGRCNKTLVLCVCKQATRALEQVQGRISVARDEADRGGVYRVEGSQSVGYVFSRGIRCHITVCHCWKLGVLFNMLSQTIQAIN